MTVTTPPIPGVESAAARPGSRADRMAQPLSRDVLRQLAEHAGVCVRPVAIRRVDRWTGLVDVLDVPCGARTASKCRPCAERNRRLRQRQIREGWHLAEEPVVAVEKPTAEVRALLALRGEYLFERERCLRAEQWAQVRDLDRGIAEVDELLAGCRLRGNLPRPGKERKPRARASRSTRRRQDAPKLPRLPVQERTVGAVYRSRSGKTHRPSMLLTITLPSFGGVHTGARMRRGHLAPCECGALHAERDPMLGTPLDGEGYDFRGQALALIFFPKVLDRFWQNYRRAVGWKIQYAGVVEMQRRLATHAHFAVRGTVSRAVTKQVAAATYHQVWWPPFDVMVYTTHRPPVWDEAEQSYLDPTTRQPLPSWAEAIAELSTQDARPAHVARLGSIDLRGVEAGTPDAERAIKYTTKYLVKDLVDQTLIKSEAQRAHADRLHQELSVLPCSPRCANWLLYGVQPDQARPDLTPGHCRGKVHQRATLGYTGRRCLVSRMWSGKTLTDHRLDGRDWFRAVTAGLLDEQQDQGHDGKNQGAGSEEDTSQDKGRYLYQVARNHDRDVDNLADRIMRSIAARNRARAALRAAQASDGAAVSATAPPNPPAAQAALTQEGHRL